MLGIRADAQREIYRGVSALDGRTLEGALAAHVRGSEQMDAVLRLGARLEPDGRVAFAGGLLVERLPPEADLPSVSHEAFAATYAGLADGDVEDLLVELTFGRIAGQEVEPLERRALQWRCSCSQERVEAMLRQLGLDELRQMRDEDHGAEVTCHFCNLAWRVDEAGLHRIIASFD
jgi:molecular chaperone Hsp33